MCGLGIRASVTVVIRLDRSRVRVGYHWLSIPLDLVWACKILECHNISIFLFITVYTCICHLPYSVQLAVYSLRRYKYSYIS